MTKPYERGTHPVGTENLCIPIEGQPPALNFKIVPYVHQGTKPEIIKIDATLTVPRYALLDTTFPISATVTNTGNGALLLSSLKYFFEKNYTLQKATSTHGLTLIEDNIVTATDIFLHRMETAYIQIELLSHTIGTHMHTFQSETHQFKPIYDFTTITTLTRPDPGEPQPPTIIPGNCPDTTGKTLNVSVNFTA